MKLMWRHRWVRHFQRNRTATLGVVAVMALGVLCCATLPVSLEQYNHQDLLRVRQSPQLDSLGGLLGFDSLGRSVLYRCLLGGAISLAIGLFAAGVAVSLGVLWGASAALLGGMWDSVMMRIVDVLYGLPYILLIILLKITLEHPLAALVRDDRLANILILLLAIGANNWLTLSRVIRSQVLSLKRQPFVEAARVYGASRSRILLRHLLPNLTGTIVVYTALIVPQAILSESFLSFLGIGIQRPMPTWGSLVADGLHAVNSVVNFWWLIVFPIALLATTLLCLHLIGEGLRAAIHNEGRA